MIIARQFIAWNASGRDPSRRNGLKVSFSARCRDFGEPGRVAAIVRSLRDNYRRRYQNSVTFSQLRVGQNRRA